VHRPATEPRRDARPFRYMRDILRTCFRMSVYDDSKKEYPFWRFPKTEKEGKPFLGQMVVLAAPYAKGESFIVTHTRERL